MFLFFFILIFTGALYFQTTSAKAAVSLQDFPLLFGQIGVSKSNSISKAAIILAMTADAVSWPKLIFYVLGYIVMRHNRHGKLNISYLFLYINWHIVIFIFCLISSITLWYSAGDKDIYYVIFFWLISYSFIATLLSMLLLQPSSIFGKSAIGPKTLFTFMLVLTLFISYILLKIWANLLEFQNIPAQSFPGFVVTIFDPRPIYTYLREAAYSPKDFVESNSKNEIYYGAFRTIIFLLFYFVIGKFIFSILKLKRTPNDLAYMTNIALASGDLRGAQKFLRKIDSSSSLYKEIRRRIIFSSGDYNQMFDEAVPVFTSKGTFSDEKIAIFFMLTDGFVLNNNYNHEKSCKIIELFENEYVQYFYERTIATALIGKCVGKGMDLRRNLDKIRFHHPRLSYINTVYSLDAQSIEFEIDNSEKDNVINFDSLIVYIMYDVFLDYLKGDSSFRMLEFLSENRGKFCDMIEKDFMNEMALLVYGPVSDFATLLQMRFEVNDPRLETLRGKLEKRLILDGREGLVLVQRHIRESLIG